jgi:hypothetical protein
MLDAKKRLVALAVIAGVGLSGCDLSQKDPNFPDSVAPTTFNALFFDTGNAPWPSDMFFLAAAASGVVDGTPAIFSPFNGSPFTLVGASLNDQDGWSTTAYTSTAFNGEIDPASIRSSTVKIVEMYLDNVTKTPATAASLPPGVASPVIRTLTEGADFTAEVSTDTDSAGKVIRITPLKPLRASEGLVNIGYVVFVTNGIQDMKGNSAQPSALYSAIKAAPANCSTFTDTLGKLACGSTKWHLAIAPAAGLDPANVVVSWSFTTQSVDDSFDAIVKNVSSQTIKVQATPATSPFGKANIYVGTTTVPYYLTKPSSTKDRVILSNVWRAAGPSPVPGFDQASRNVTRFNPMPGKTTDVTIPVLVTVPNSKAAGGACTKPAAGWPVAIVQHGLGRNRTDSLAIADAFADACFVVAAIDLALHGITDTTNPFYQKDYERTFNVDLMDNATSQPAVPTNPNAPGDGKIDDSGASFVNVISPATMRDNLRQSEADLIVFTKSLAKLDLNGDGVVDVNPARITYTSQSAGSVVGGSHIHFVADTQTAMLNVGGGGLTQLFLDSTYYGPRIRAVLGAPKVLYGYPFGWELPVNSTLFNNFARDIQTLVDSADPLNHILDAQAVVPLVIQRVNGDTIVPNSATNRLIAEGKLKQVSALGPTAIGEGSGGWVAFTAGDHGSLFSPAASAAATVEMQTQAVKFAASAGQPGGPFLVITNPAVIQQ